MMDDNDSLHNDLKKSENEEKKTKAVMDMGQLVLGNSKARHHIRLLNIIGEIEGHDLSPSSVKTTKYEHVLPFLAMVEDDKDIDGLLVLLNTVGGDVEAGLAIAEMIASISKPVVTLVLGGGHSIGVPLSVSGKESFIVPTATMVVHPIRIGGTVLGVQQNYEYIDRMQERIIDFTASHSGITKDEIKHYMFNTKELTKDIGSMLVGKDAVDAGLIRHTGGIQDALSCLHKLIEEDKKK